jgi:hypothetical protein
MNRLITSAPVLAMFLALGCAAAVEPDDELNPISDVAAKTGAPTTSGDTPAAEEAVGSTVQAVSSCYGSSCVGKDPVQMRCDRDTSRVETLWLGSRSLHLVYSWNCAALYALYIVDSANYSLQTTVSERKRTEFWDVDGVNYWDEWQSKSVLLYTGRIWSPMNSSTGGSTHIACANGTCTGSFAN